MLIQSLYLLATAALALASPTSKLIQRDSCSGTVYSGQWDLEDTGPYTIYNDLWGSSAATSGSQSFQCLSLSGSTLSWQTTWTWTGGAGSVKSYANTGLDMSSHPTLASVNTLKSTWRWSYTSASNVIANVAYDLWLGSTASCGTSATCTTYEIMVWLSRRGGALPAGSSTGATLTIGGASFTLYKGTVSSWTVFSFIPTSASSEYTNFSADLMGFLDYLVSHQGVSTSNYLSGIGAGTEPFTGSATLETTAYSVTVA